jgi:hypothetical protein
MRPCSLQEVLDAATEPARINDARRALDSAMQEINTLNEAMVGAYGFSIGRNYTMQINKSSLYVWATEDEVQGIAQVLSTVP